MHSFRSAGNSTRITPRWKWVHPKDRIKNWNIVKGDKVVVIAGKDKGQQGEIWEVRRKTNSVIIKELKLAKKATPHLGWVKKPQPIHVSNVMLQHPHTREPVRIERRKAEVELHDGRKALKYCRFVRNTDIMIKKPPLKFGYRPEEDEPVCNTPPEEASKITFEPDLAVKPLPPGVIDELRNRYYKFPYRTAAMSSGRTVWQAMNKKPKMSHGV